MKKLKFKPVIGECAVCQKALNGNNPRHSPIYVVGSKLACSQRHADKLEYEYEPSPASQQADGAP